MSAGSAGGVSTIQKEGFHTNSYENFIIIFGVSTIQKEGFHTISKVILGQTEGVSTIQKEDFHAGNNSYLK